MIILIGRSLSPFVRRILITIKLYDLAYEQRPYKLIDPHDREEITKVNPLGRVPALILDDGSVIIESSAILDYLDRQVEEEKRLTPADGQERVKVNRIAGLATGCMDRIVANYYERTRRPEQYRWAEHIAHLFNTAAQGFRELDRHSEQAKGDFLVGKTLTQADISTAVVADFADLVCPDLAMDQNYPSLAKLRKKLQQFPPFPQTAPRL